MVVDTIKEKELALTTKHALLIGINKYPFYEKSEKIDLGGCVNDAKRMRLVLVDHFKFDPARICELHDEAATREAILSEMERLVKVVQEDDIVVFHYSGHGRRRKAKLRENTELRPNDGETFDQAEGSGFDSTLMPSNTGPYPHPHLDITDNTINNWLKRLTAITPNVTLIFDSCHSGTVTRGGDEVKVRTVAADDRTPLELEETTPEAGAVNAPAKTKKGKSGWLPLSDRYTVIAGSRDSETSKETDVSSGSPFDRHGALSYHLINALLEAVPGTTHRDVFEIAGANVTAWYSTQHPQVEGALDREIFGTREIRPMKFIPIVSVNGDTAVLGGGAAHGLRDGSVWDIYPLGTKQVEGTPPFGVMNIEQVGPLTSKARIVSHSGEVSKHCRCVERNKETETNALQINNATSSLDVEFNIFKVASNGELESANDELEFNAGERLAFEVINNEERAVFVSILHFGLNGAIQLLYPRRKSSEMIAGGIRMLKGAGRAKLRVNLDGFNGDKAAQSYKAFVASQPIDLAWLCRDATTDQPASSKRKPKQQSAKRATATTRSSAAENEKLLDGPDDWLTVTRSIVVKRSAQ
jgi:hypothetical protein